MIYEFNTGCMAGDDSGWYIETDREVTHHRGLAPCKHCSDERDVTHKRSDNSTYTTRVWICPRVVIAENQCGNDITAICLDCILEAAATLPAAHSRVDVAAKAMRAEALKFRDPVSAYVETEALTRYEKAHPDDVAAFVPNIDWELESWKILARAALGVDAQTGQSGE